MAERKTYDWEAIERDYRAGVLSIREIARTYGCSDAAIRKRAKRCGWERDLSAKVAEKVRNDLVRNQVRTNDPITEKQIVEQAAATQVLVVHRHRETIAKGQENVSQMLEELAEMSVNRDEIEEAILEETSGGDNISKRTAMLKAVSLQSRSQILHQVATSMKIFIEAERKAFNIDGERDNNATATLKDILAEIDGTSKGLPNV